MKTMILVLISVLFHCRRAIAEVDVGVRSTKYAISVIGVVNNTYDISAIGFNFYAPLTLSMGGNLFFEREGQKYIGGGGGLQYFPWSPSGLQDTSDKYMSVKYSDDLRTYLGLSGGFGRLRLLSDSVGANEVGIGLNNFDIVIGNLFRISRWNFGFEVGYGYANTTSDTALSITSISRTILRLAVYYQL